MELKPEGACRGEMCVPIASDVRPRITAEHGAQAYYNFTVLADVLGRPWAGDLKHSAWYFGTEAAARANDLRALKAPEFELPDLDGRIHRLADSRGKKVLLVSWASW